MSFNGDYVTNEFGICPECSQAILYYEITRYDSDEFLLTNHHSGGRRCYIICRAETRIVSRGGNKIGKKKQECEIVETYRKNDIDRPGTETVEFIFRNYRTSPTSVFHVVKYIKSSDFKHIDCKTYDNGVLCNNEWKYDSGEPIDNYFSFEHNPEADYLQSFKIQCLKCNAKYDCVN